MGVGWVAYAVLFLGTIVKRRVQHIYVANWFYAAFIITVTLLHIVNNLSIPVSLTKSYPIYSGAVDAMVQCAWHKLRTDPILKFLIVAISFYMMSTFERPMMSIKTVNSLSHYTDWTIGHVHSGALGWVAMISIGSIYVLMPSLVGAKPMWSIRLINVHFWLHTLGVVFYIASMWIAGVMQVAPPSAPHRPAWREPMV